MSETFKQSCCISGLSVFAFGNWICVVSRIMIKLPSSKETSGGGSKRCPDLLICFFCCCCSFKIALEKQIIISDHLLIILWLDYVLNTFPFSKCYSPCSAYLILQICAQTPKLLNTPWHFLDARFPNLFNLFPSAFLPSWYVHWHLFHSTPLTLQLLIRCCPCEEVFRKQCSIFSSVCWCQLWESLGFCSCSGIGWQIQFIWLCLLLGSNLSTLCVLVFCSSSFFVIIYISCHTLSVCWLC